MKKYNLRRLSGQLAVVVWLSVILPVAVVAAEVAVTLPPLAGLVAMLDKKAKVLCLLPSGSDPHHFQLTPRKIEALERTGLLFRSSRDDGGWPLAPYHARSVDIWPDHDHAWLDPAMVRQALPDIAKALVALNPDRRADIYEALALALKKTREIESAWQQTLVEMKVGGVLMQHPAWQRLMQAMGVPVLDVLESGQHGHEHGPHKLEHALKALNESPQAWLIADQGHSNRALDWLQQHREQTSRRVELDALGLCSQPWQALMLENMRRIQTAKKL